MFRSLRDTLPHDLSAEFIFVDDGSTDGTRSWLESLADRSVHVLLNLENCGFAASVNRGAARAVGEILILLNNDLVLTPGWLSPLLRQYARLGSTAGVLGNVQRRVDNGSIDHAGITINEKGKPEHIQDISAGGPAAWFRGWRKVPAVTGACLLISRRLWQELGGFDERFVNGCEDVDLCFRAISARKTNLVVLRSSVFHHVSSSVGRKLRDERNTLRLTLKWRDTLALFAARRWSEHYLSEEWRHPRAPTQLRAAIQVFLHAFRLRHTPPAFVLLGTEAAIEHEIKRWRQDLCLDD